MIEVLGAGIEAVVKGVTSCQIVSPAECDREVHFLHCYCTLMGIKLRPLHFSCWPLSLVEETETVTILIYQYILWAKA